MKCYSLAVVSIVTMLVLVAALFSGLTISSSPATAAPAASANTA